MGFWNWLTGGINHDGVTGNTNTNVPPPDTIGNGFRAGDPDGFEFEALPDDYEFRALPSISAMPWAGWPATWSTPTWAGSDRYLQLVDTAWACLDLNASVLSTMPVYKMRGGQVVEPESWMTNPDPRIYQSWHEFAKQLFWDYQLGEAFVWVTDYYSSGWPMFFRVLPPYLVTPEMVGGQRTYRIGQVDITGSVLHIRYKSSTDSARGVGPLEAAGARMIAAGVLARYVSEIAQGGGVPFMTLETDAELNAADAQDLLDQWVTARQSNIGRPAVLDNGLKAVPHQMSPKDMALLEVAQFNESRIAVMLGVPPFLVGLPSGGDSMTYSNVSSLFDFHDRASLRPKAASVMSALSEWSLPRGSTVELNRDEYTRPAFGERADAWVKLVTAGMVTADEYRAAERLHGEAPEMAATAITGGDIA